MRLHEIESGHHTPHDWSKRLSSSYIYGTVNGVVNTPEVLYVRAIGEVQGTNLNAFKSTEIYVRTKHTHGDHVSARLSDLDVISFKPDPGIYNVRNKYPISLTHTTYRQWHFGCTNETIRLVRLSGQAIPQHYVDLEFCFNPVYPTIGNAIELLKTKERKHVAISPKVSILASGKSIDRFVLLYNFLPLATINNGMWFPSQSGKALEKIANEYKHVLMSLI